LVFLSQAINETMKTPRFITSLMVTGLLVMSILSARAQWLTQSMELKPGWSAVYLHVDASYATLQELVDADNNNPIVEVWLWMPAPETTQFVQDPQLPTTSSSQWLSWLRSLGPSSALQRLTGNAAYLIRQTNATSYTWHLKGKPVSPRYSWTSTGLNFLGFPALATNPPTFDAFWTPYPDLQQQAEIYRYVGGDLGSNNPARLFAFRTTPVQRGEAFWIRAGDLYNRYFGPFELELQTLGGINFRDYLGQSSLRLRNLANSSVTVSVQLLPSEAPPVGQTPVVQAPPVLLRGAMNLTNLTYTYSDLTTGPQQWQLAPQGQAGSEVEVVLGLNRYPMTGPAGALYAGILRFTDSLNLSQVDVPVSAQVGSAAGLWVGNAWVQYVSEYLKTYAQATNLVDFTNLLVRLQLSNGVDGYNYAWDSTTGRVLVYGGPNNKSGSYLLDGPIKTDSGSVARPFALRLILHNDGEKVRLLQKVFVGMGLGSNEVVTTQENLLLKDQLASARRISSVHLPTSSGNIPWDCAGLLQPGSNVTVTVNLSHDDQASNPFLHTYHPDHDNLNTQFDAELEPGYESFNISRQITLNITPPDNDFASMTTGNQSLSGNYVETITFLGKIRRDQNGQVISTDAQSFHVLGLFSLKRIATVPALTMP
jgi:hypothetical protein